MTTSKLTKIFLSISVMGALAACDVPASSTGRIANPENFPDEVAEQMVNLYLVNSAIEDCPGLAVTESTYDAGLNKMLLTAAAHNVDDDAILKHWQSDDTTAKEDKYFLRFFEKHNFSFEESKHQGEICAALAKEDAANSVIGKMVQRK